MDVCKKKKTDMQVSKCFILSGLLAAGETPNVHLSVSLCVGLNFSFFHYFLGVWNPWWYTRTRFWYITSKINTELLFYIFQKLFRLLDMRWEEMVDSQQGATCLVGVHLISFQTSASGIIVLLKTPPKCKKTGRALVRWFRALVWNLEAPGSNPPRCHYLDLLSV